MIKLKRGVWEAPFLGPNGETVFVAVRGDGRIVGEPASVPSDAEYFDRAAAVAALLERLNRDDPVRRCLTLVRA